MQNIYKSKKTYKLKSRLKTLLTILLVALISTTVYMLSRDVYSEDDIPVISPNTNTTWYNDFNYTLDNTNYTITLNSFTATGYTDYSIPASAEISGNAYQTIVGKYDSDHGIFYNSTVKNITLEPDVLLLDNAEKTFAYCFSLETINLSNIDTSNVINMNHMFYQCENLKYIDLTGFDTSNVTTMQAIFCNCYELISLDLSSFDTSNVTNMREMFQECHALTSINLTSFNTENVTDMWHLFWYCESLPELNISSFRTPKITNMRAMFAYCRKLESIDISNFDTSHVTEMAYMFQETNSLKNLNIGNFNTSSAVTMEYMFYNSYKLKKIDLSLFDTSNVTSMINMFGGNDNVNTLVLGPNYNFTSDCGLTGNWKRDGDTTVYTAAQLIANYNGSTMAGTYRNMDMPAYAIIYDSGKMVIQRTNEPDATLGTVVGTYTGFETTTYTSSANVPWASEVATVTTVIFDDEILPVSTAYWFYGMTNLTSISNIADLLTASTTNMKGMFQNCSSLTTVTLSGFDTSNVTDISYMFSGCSNIKNLNINSFNTANVTTMENFFQDMTNLFSITLGVNWSFNGAGGLTGSWVKRGSTVTYTAANLASSYNGATMSGTYTNVSQTPYAIVYNQSGTYSLVFQLGNTTESSRGTVVRTIKDFDNDKYNSESSVPWYNYRQQIKTIVFKNTISPKSTAYWFYGFTKLSSISNLSRLNTSSVTDMQYMFYNCSKLTTLAVSGFNTSSVTNMQYMFYGCSSVTSLSVGSFNTSNVRSMAYMFYGCESITSLSFSSSFSTIKVTSMAHMFHDCIRLKSVSLSTAFNNTKALTTTHSMFRNCESLTSITLSLKASGVSTMAYMFSGCTMLSTINITNLTTSRLTSMSYMFYECTRVKTLDFTNFNAQRVTSMTDAFSYTVSLMTLKLGRNWKFKSGNGLTGTWKNSRTGTSYSATNLTQNYQGSTMYGTYRRATASTTKCALLYDSGELVFQAGSAADDTKGTVVGVYVNFINTTYTTKSEVPWLRLDKNITTVTFDATISPTSTAYWFQSKDELTTINNISNLNTSSATDISHMFSGCSGLTTLDVSGFDTTNVTTMRSLFYNCSGLTTINLTSFTTTNTTDMGYMFYGCSGLTTLDVSGLVTTNVTDMSYMFYNCNNISTLNVSNFSTANVVTMAYMFYGCSGLTALNLSNFVTTSLTKTNHMFYNCSSLTSLNLSNFNTSNVTTMTYMFYNCNSLTSLNVNSFNTANVTTMSYMFNKCSSLTSLDISSFNTGSLTTMASMFTNTTELITLKLGTNWSFLSSNGLTKTWKRDGDSVRYTSEELTSAYNGATMAGTYRAIIEAYAEFDSSNGQLRIFRDVSSSYTDGQVIGTKTYYTGIETITGNVAPKWYANRENIISVIIEDLFKPKTACDMFYECTNLTTITGIEYLDTSDATSMAAMFRNCSNLTTLDVSGFDTSNVTTMFCMFYNCANLSALDLSNFNTNNVTRMDGMFFNCNSLTVLDVSSFNTSNVTRMDSMFGGCKCTSLNLSNFNTSNVTNMSQMFTNCSNLTNLDLSNFNTSNVTNMGQMFYECEDLETLNISSFNTNNVNDMNYMFSGCRALTNLNISGFNTSNVTNMRAMFQGCTSFTSLDLSNFDTSNVTDMGYMFNTDGNIKTLNISSFDTSSLVTMTNMFRYCTKLDTLMLGTNWNFLSSNGLDKSWLRDGDTTAYTATELTNSYNGSTMSGTYRAVTKLTIVETVKGSLANTNKNFDFTINVQNEGTGINTTHAYTGSKTGNLVFSNGNATFNLKHNENISLYFPIGYTYTITQNPDGYTLNKTNDTGSFGSSDITSTFTDLLTGTTPTGIFIDLIPFIILITFGVLGIFLINKYKYI